MHLHTLIEIISITQAFHLAQHFHTLGQTLGIAAISFPKFFHPGCVQTAQFMHPFIKELRRNMEFHTQIYDSFRIERLHTFRFFQIQLHQQQPVFILPMNVLCHKPFDLCYKDTANERNNKIKIKVFIFVFQSAAFSYEKIQ